LQATRVSRPDALAHEIAVGLVRTWLRFKVQEITLPVMIGALEIRAIYGLAYWDAAILWIGAPVSLAFLEEKNIS
jgi:hypothetical protein